MPKIFMSYRRADSASTAGRLYDQLVGRFGRDTVFKDVDSIPPGVKFAEYIEEAIRESAVALIIIGPRWLNASSGWRRRLDDPGDFVRIEVETALRLGIMVIPLLVDGAAMPPAQRLPASLRPLIQRNALPVRPDPDFHRDVERALAAVERQLAAPPPAPPVAGESAAPPAPLTGAPAVAESPPARIPPVTQPRPRVAGEPVAPWPGSEPAAAPPGAPASGGATLSPAPSTSPVTPAPSAPGAPLASTPVRKWRASRGALYGALALLLVALLATAPFTLPKLGARLFPLTAAQKTATASTQEAAAEQTALASFTPIFYTSPTPTPTPVILPIAAGYTAASPGCDSQRWDPQGATPQCSATAMTLTHDSVDDAITATVTGAPAAYSVDITISNLQGAAWGYVTLNDLVVGIAPYPATSSYPAGAFCQVAEPWSSANSIGASISLVSSYHIHITVSATAGRTGTVAIQVNGVSCWYPDEGGANVTFAPGPLRTLSLTLSDQAGASNPPASDAVTFSNLTLTTP